MYEFDLSNEEAMGIFREMIMPQAIAGIEPEAVKKAFILGGQPGSGKSACAREILKRDKNTVFVNGDDLRAYHPRYYFYLRDNDIEAADLTQAVCNYWIERLIDECISNGFNFIVEGTMRKIDAPLRTAQKAKNVGYNVNLAVISTPYELSLLSLERRYQEIKRLEGFARYTKKESHDEAYNNIEQTLAELSDSGLFNRFIIYSRYPGGFEEYNFEASERKKALNEFRNGRMREIKEKEREILNILPLEISMKK